jgi:hypothetical protein
VGGLGYNSARFSLMFVWFSALEEGHDGGASVRYRGNTKKVASDIAFAKSRVGVDCAPQTIYTGLSRYAVLQLS